MNLACFLLLLLVCPVSPQEEKKSFYKHSDDLCFLKYLLKLSIVWIEQLGCCIIYPAFIQEQFLFILRFPSRAVPVCRVKSFKSSITWDFKVLIFPLLMKPYLTVDVIQDGRCWGTKMHSSADASRTVIRKVKGQCINLLSFCSFQPLPLLCIIDELEHSLSFFPSAEGSSTRKNGAPENLLQLPFGCRSQCVRCFSLCVHLEVYSARPSQRPESVIFSTRQPWNQFSAPFSAMGNCQSWSFF